MASRNHDEEDHTLDDSGYISNYRDYESDQQVSRQISRTHTPGGIEIGIVSIINTNSSCLRPATRRSHLVGTNPLRSRIPVTTNTTTPCYTDHISVARYDGMLLEVRCALSRPSLTARQQTQLCDMMGSLERIREAAQNALSGIDDLVLQNSSPPVYGPRLRPLSEAAVTQNVQAQTRRSYATSLIRQGHCFPHTPVYTSYPVRYNDAYDDIMGTRFLDDGSPAVYAKRDGRECTYALRFAQEYHNGLKKKRAHLHITTDDRNLVEARQARALVGLSTKDMDDEITYRVLRNMNSWGWLGQCVHESEWAHNFPCPCGEVIHCRRQRSSHSGLVSA
jgi:hypothetical protein